ncbi:Zinc finger BED domain-containing protein DAYSLEEPER, partial [Bienertia sinuspersici]
MCIAVVLGPQLDPQIKMRSVEITFLKMYSDDDSRENIHKVKATLGELYDAYASMYSSFATRLCGSTTSTSSGSGVGGKSSRKLEIETYLEQRSVFIDENSQFDVSEWWKDRACEFPILSRIADGRVIDPYRASSSLETIQMLICTRDWCRSLHGIKRKNKDKEAQPKELIITIEL